MLRITLTAAILVMLLPTAKAQAADKSKHLEKAVSQHRKHARESADKSGLPAEVRNATWRLLIAQLAGQEDMDLHSGTFDAATEGLEAISQIARTLSDDIEAQQTLASDPLLAVRLDAAMTRIPAVRKLLQVSREEELERLSQLRQLNRNYRSLVEELLAAQASLLLGDVATVAEHVSASESLLQQNEQIAGERRDFYLFDDEPNLEPDAEQTGQQELTLVTETAKPYTESTGRWQKIVSAYASLHHALKSTSPDVNLLTTSIEQATQAKAESTASAALAEYIVGAASLELAAAETRPDPSSTAAHDQAAPHVAAAREALKRCQAQLEQYAGEDHWKQQLSDLSLLASDAASVMNEADRLLFDQRSPAEAIALLRKGQLYHPSAELSLWLTELEWRVGLLSTDDALTAVENGEAGGLLESASPNVVLLKARMAIRHAIASKQYDRARLDEAMSSLTGLPQEIDTLQRQEAEALLAIGSVLDTDHGSRDGEDRARASMKSIGLLASDLSQSIQDLDGRTEIHAAEAAKLARLAEGYLNVRFADDHGDRGFMAFSASESIPAPFPPSVYPIQRDGSELLKAVLSRPDANIIRLAAEQRQLRAALQQLLPAAAAAAAAGGRQGHSASGERPTVFDDAAATNILNMLDPAVASVNAQLDPGAAREESVQVRSDAASIAAQMFTADGKPEQAVNLLLALVSPNMKAASMQTTDWQAAFSGISKLADPLAMNAFAEAVEEFAAVELPVANGQRGEVLNQCLQMQQQLSGMLDSHVSIGRRWPFLNNSVEAALLRLQDPEYYRNEANRLRNSLQISAARELLEQGTSRHPGSDALLIELAETYLDEIELHPSQADSLTAKAIGALEGITTETVDPTTNLLLGRLYEQTGEHTLAITHYNTAAAEGSEDVALVAGSRSVALQVATLADN